MSTITHNRFWRIATLLVRTDMALGIIATAALLIWVNWH
jgi:hypothetical protein